MRKIYIAAIALAFMGTVAQGQEAVASPTSATATVTTNGNTYLDVLRSCGAEWKVRADKTAKGMEAWQAFRRNCTNEKGWVAKGGRKKGGKATENDKG